MALYWQCNIAMQNVICLQLMEVAFRKKCGLTVTYVKALGTLLPASAELIKEEGKNLFLQNPYIWKERPLKSALIAYSKSDVEELIPLYDKFNAQLSDSWMNKVKTLSKQRVEVYKNPNFDFSNAQARRNAPRF